MNPLLVFPILIPMLCAAASLVFWRARRAQRILGLAGSFGLLASGIALLLSVHSRGIQAMQVGHWPAPFGIILVADLFSAIMVALGGLMGATVVVYSTATIDRRRELHGYYPLFNVLLMGVSGAFLTGDIFNLYVWFEVMLIASFVLMALGGEPGQIEGALKYVTLNLVSSMIFLIAVGLLYGLAGTLNMADLSGKLRSAEHSGLIVALSMMFLVAFGIKAAVFPLFFWLPASYHTPPVAVSAIFAGLLTKVGVYAMIRTFTLIFVQDVSYTHTIILVISGLTMVTGVLGAMAQNEFRRILSFHIVSQIGYMVMGLGLFTPLALAGSVFYIIHHIIVKTNLFLISGLAHRIRGAYELKKLGGLYQTRPALAFMFLIPALSLAGLPPLSGFFAKLSLVQAGLQSKAYLIVAVSLAVSLLTLFSMTKIWNEAFWRPPEKQGQSSERLSLAMWVPVIALAAITVAIGAAAGPVFNLSQQAAEQLVNPAAYITAVLGRQ